MEYALGVGLLKLIYLWQQESFNPYSIGICSRRHTILKQRAEAVRLNPYSIGICSRRPVPEWVKALVNALILILMEYALGELLI